MHHPRHQAKPSTAQRVRGAALLLALLALSAAAAIYGPELPALPRLVATMTGGNPVAQWAAGWLLVVVPLAAVTVLLLLGTWWLRWIAAGSLAVTLPLLILLGKPRGQSAQQWRNGDIAPFSAAIEITSLAILLLAALAALIFVIRLAAWPDATMAWARATERGADAKSRDRVDEARSAPSPQR